MKLQLLHYLYCSSMKSTFMLGLYPQHVVLHLFLPRALSVLMHLLFFYAPTLLFFTLTLPVLDSLNLHVQLLFSLVALLQVLNVSPKSTCLKPSFVSQLVPLVLLLRNHQIRISSTLLFEANKGENPIIK